MPDDPLQVAFMNLLIFWIVLSGHRHLCTRDALHRLRLAAAGIGQIKAEQAAACKRGDLAAIHLAIAIGPSKWSDTDQRCP